MDLLDHHYGETRNVIISFSRYDFYFYAVRTADDRPAGSDSCPHSWAFDQSEGDCRARLSYDGRIKWLVAFSGQTIVVDDEYRDHKIVGNRTPGGSSVLLRADHPAPQTGNGQGKSFVCISPGRHRAGLLSPGNSDLYGIGESRTHCAGDDYVCDSSDCDRHVLCQDAAGDAE